MTPGIGSLTLNMMIRIEQTWTLRISNDTCSFEEGRLPAQERSLQELVQKQFVVDGSEPCSIGMYGTWARRSHAGKEIRNHIIMPNAHVHSQPEMPQGRVQMSEQNALSHLLNNVCG